MIPFYIISKFKNKFSEIKSSGNIDNNNNMEIPNKH